MNIHRPVGSKGRYNQTSSFSKEFERYYFRYNSKPIRNSKRKAAMKKITEGFLKLIIEDDYFYWPALGTFGMVKEPAKKTTRLRRVDWTKTIELWSQLYVGKTDEEIKAIKNKPKIKYKNALAESVSIIFIPDDKKTIFRYIPITSIRKQLGRINTKRALMSKLRFKEYLNALRKNNIT